MNKLKLVLLLIILIACNTKHEKLTYYPSGKIHEQFVFTSENEKSLMKNYEYIKYYENGKVKVKYRVENKLKNGECIDYYENGSLNTIIMYTNDTVNGIVKLYDSAGQLAYESLFVKGVHEMQMSINDAGGKYISQIYYDMTIDDVKKAVVGNLLIKPTGEIDTSKSCNYYAQGKDTITEGEIYNLKITTYTNDIENYISEAVFGDFDTSFEVKDSSKFTFLKSKNNKLTYSFKPLKVGRNVIIGKLHIYNTPNAKTSIDRDFLFYKDFYVKEK